MAHSYDKGDKLGRFIKGEKTKRVCLYCKQEYYDVPTRRNKFCSRQCANAWRKENTYQTKKRAPRITYTCVNCGKKTSKTKKRWGVGKLRFCSVKCHHEYCKKNPNKYPSWKGGKIEKSCIRCGKKFLVYPYRKYRKYCSIKCASKRILKTVGSTKERVLKKDLESKGYFVTKSAGSLGIWDLVAFKKDQLLLIQVKKLNHYPYASNIKKVFQQFQKVQDKLPSLATQQLSIWVERKGWHHYIYENTKDLI